MFCKHSTSSGSVRDGQRTVTLMPFRPSSQNSNLLYERVVMFSIPHKALPIAHSGSNSEVCIPTSNTDARILRNLESFNGQKSSLYFSYHSTALFREYSGPSTCFRC